MKRPQNLLMREAARYVAKGLLKEEEVMTKNKYYVVITEETSAIYESLTQAREKSTGVKGSRLYGFKTREQAEACVAHNAPAVKEEVIQDVKPDAPFVQPKHWYVDGAYFPLNQTGYYGVVYGELKDYGQVPAAYLTLESYGTELYACKRAIELALANDVTHLYIYSDNTSVVHFFQNQCVKACYQPAEQEVKDFFDVMRRYIQIEVEHIRVAPDTSIHKKAHLLCQNGRLFLPIA